MGKREDVRSSKNRKAASKFSIQRFAGSLFPKLARENRRMSNDEFRAAEVKKSLTPFVASNCYNQSMSIKERPNHPIYIRALRRMSAAERLEKAFELTEFSKQLFLHGLRRRFPDLSEKELHGLFLKRLEKCHNRHC